MKKAQYVCNRTFKKGTYKFTDVCTNCGHTCVVHNYPPEEMNMTPMNEETMEELTKHDKERYMRLEKRAQWLRERILQNTHLHKDMSYDKSELSALEWAMRCILKYIKDHPKEELC